MASDRAQLNQALRKWDYLHEKGKYSLPVDDGSVAILCSDWGVMPDDEIVAEVAAYREEAQNIAELLTSRGIDNHVFQNFTVDEALEVIEDPSVVSVVTIGNGNLSAVYAHSGDELDWRLIAQHATHLKTGRFVQRHCGQSIRDLSVPLGTFAVDDHSNVFAAHDVFLPTVMDGNDDDLIVPVHKYRRVGYRALKSLFPRREEPKSEESEAPTS